MPDGRFKRFCSNAERLAWARRTAAHPGRDVVPIPCTADSRNGRLMHLLLDELNALPVLPMHLPNPTDARLKRIWPNCVVNDNRCQLQFG